MQKTHTTLCYTITTSLNTSPVQRPRGGTGRRSILVGTLTELSALRRMLEKTGSPWIACEYVARCPRSYWCRKSRMEFTM
eukprot:2544357-Pyramimonas_sp.AAC.1